jgi:hypothetical protein
MQNPEEKPRASKLKNTREYARKKGDEIRKGSGILNLFLKRGILNLF